MLETVGLRFRGDEALLPKDKLLLGRDCDVFWAWVDRGVGSVAGAGVLGRGWPRCLTSRGLVAGAPGRARRAAEDPVRD